MHNHLMLFIDHYEEPMHGFVSFLSRVSMQCIQSTILIYDFCPSVCPSVSPSNDGHCIGVDLQ